MGKVFRSVAVATLSLVGLISAAHADANRGKVYVYDASISAIIPNHKFRGVKVLNDGIPSKEVQIASTVTGKNMLTKEAVKVSKNVNAVQQFYFQNYGRAGFDGNGGDIHVAVNTNRLMPIDLVGMQQNAAWLETENMFAFGRGGDYFTDFTGALDVVGHEFTHAVINRTSNLAYNRESGALNESLADVFGVMIRQYFANGRYPNPFLVGDTVLTDKGLTKARALRDMENPHKGLSPQPAMMSEITQELGPSCKPSNKNDNCGVHILSGIPNRAASLVIKSIGWEASSKLFYTVMTQRLKPNSTFADYRDAVVAECEVMGGFNACEGVRAAFSAVGL